jgi:hypothetical protein
MAPKSQVTCEQHALSFSNKRLSHPNRLPLESTWAAEYRGTTKQGGSIGVRRRDFIALVAGGAVSTPVSATLAQQRVRRIGVLSPLAEDDPEDRRRMAAFLEELQRLGWRNGDNLRIEQRRHLGSPAEA